MLKRYQEQKLAEGMTPVEDPFTLDGETAQKFEPPRPDRRPRPRRGSLPVPLQDFSPRARSSHLPEGPGVKEEDEAPVPPRGRGRHMRTERRASSSSFRAAPAAEVSSGSSTPKILPESPGPSPLLSPESPAASDHRSDMADAGTGGESPPESARRCPGEDPEIAEGSPEGENEAIEALSAAVSMPGRSNTEDRVDWFACIINGVWLHPEGFAIHVSGTGHLTMPRGDYNLYVRRGTDGSVLCDDHHILLKSESFADHLVWEDRGDVPGGRVHWERLEPGGPEARRWRHGIHLEFLVCEREEPSLY